MGTNNISVQKIVSDSFSYVFSNMGAFVGPLVLPIVGQLAGIALAVGPALMMSSGLSSVNFVTVILGFIFGMSVFFYTFWRLLLVMGSYPLITRDLISRKRLETSESYCKTIDARKGAYTTFIILAGLASVVLAILPTLALMPLSSFIPLPAVVAGIAKTVVFVMFLTVFSSVFFFIFIPAFVVERNFSPSRAMNSAFEAMKNNCRGYISLSIILVVLYIIFNLIPIIGIFLMILLVPICTVAYSLLYFGVRR